MIAADKPGNQKHFLFSASVSKPSICLDGGYGRVPLTALVLFVPLFVLATTEAAAQSAPFCRAGQTPQFELGFATLKNAVGAAMGVAVECEYPNNANGDTLQKHPLV